MASITLVEWHLFLHCIWQGLTPFQNYKNLHFGLFDCLS